MISVDPGELRPYMGQWVAVKDGHVMAHAGTPEALITEIRERGEAADSVFRVPLDSGEMP